MRLTDAFCVVVVFPEVKDGAGDNNGFDFLWEYQGYSSYSERFGDGNSVWGDLESWDVVGEDIIEFFHLSIKEPKLFLHEFDEVCEP